MSIRVCHMTSAHRSNDTRIFYKQCVSLAKAGYEVYLVANGESYKKSGVQVIGTGDQVKTRARRMIKTTKKIYKIALEINADIYHLHDPELLPYALKLKRKGKKVIFDSHEDYLSTISEKRWIPTFLRPAIKKAYVAYEKYIASKLDGAIVCYHWTEERFKKSCARVKMVLNYPIIDKDLRYPLVNLQRRAISFAGGITSQWCHKEILQAIGRLSGVTYELAGKLNGVYGSELKRMKEWDKVNYHGVLPIKEVFTKVYANSSIGMALLDYISQCRGTVGNLSNTKFFEYMYMGLPLICTDFTLWKQIIDEEKCGVYVNPHDIDSITNAIAYLLDNPEIAKKMGENGHNAVLRKYNWKTEETKLLELYLDILNQNR